MCDSESKLRLEQAMSEAESEYSLQYWGFTPQQFFQEFGTEILDEMSAIFNDRLSNLSAGLVGSPDDERLKLLEATVELHQTWCERAEAALNAVQPTIEDFFTIPKNVLLPEDGRLLYKQFSEEEVAKLQLEVQQLEEQYTKEIEDVALIEKELAVLERVELLDKKVDEGLEEVKKFEETLNEIRQLEEVAQEFEEAKTSLLSGDEDDYEDSLYDYFAALYFHRAADD